MRSVRGSSKGFTNKRNQSVIDEHRTNTGYTQDIHRIPVTFRYPSGNLTDGFPETSEAAKKVSLNIFSA
jgi:hypothetical protein